MYRLHFILIVIAGITILTACSNRPEVNFRNENGNLIEETFYKNSQLKTRTIYIGGDSLDYISTSYYENGELRDSSHYINGKLEGLRLYFDQEGGLVHRENYSDGTLNGPHSGSYKSGITSFEGYRLNGLKVGEWIFHYPKGEPITYEFYDSTGKLLYFSKYDQEGKVTEQKGKHIIQVNTKPGVLKVNQEFQIEVIAATPPGFDSFLEIKLNDGRTLFSEALSSPQISINHQFNQAGSFQVDVICKFTNTKSGDQVTDSKSVVVTVYENV